jgi:YfiH family protein
MKAGGGVAGLCDAVLSDRGIAHGFGQRGSEVPVDTYFARQVHGIGVWQTEISPRGRHEADLPEADVVVVGEPGWSAGIVTADCVPILAAREDGVVVAAIHAGWRGLAAGVIEAGIGTLRGRAAGRPLVAAIGPAARGCCYEVDEPVRAALSDPYARWLEGGILRPGRPGHYLLDLPALAEQILLAGGIEAACLGTQHRVCTICDPERFESFRRDGAEAGRARHFITAGPLPGGEG